MGRCRTASDDTGDKPRGNSGRVEIVDLKPEHASIVTRLRKVDIKEVQRSSPLPVWVSVCLSIACSDMGWAALVDGQVEAIFGVGINNDPWFLATDVLDKHKVKFLRESQHYIGIMKDKYDWLINWIDPDNKLTARWLKWSGFTIDEPDPLRGGFRRFHWRKDESKCVQQ